MHFDTFKSAVATQFAWMQKHPLFRVAVEGDALWAMYLGSFPTGTNPIYRERTEHDCSCCKQFIRQVGGVVAVVDDEVVSVWDGDVPDPAYRQVAAALSAFVSTRPIAAPFLHYERTVGTDRNFEQIVGASTTNAKVWTHFHVNLDKNYVAKKDSIATLLGVRRAEHDVLLRSLKEITEDAVDTALDLVAQNSLYRGEEHREALMGFRILKQEFARLSTDEERDRFAWTAETFGAVSRMRNTSIGTLLVDLSNGVELEDAVKSYEVKVAPANYKRPTALITKAMIDKAKEKLNELGLTSALERRFAKLTDISIANVLFANRNARKAVGGDVFDELSDQVGTSTGRSFAKVEEVPVDLFLHDVLPRAQALEVLLENRHVGNLVSLIAPLDPTARPLFKWPNNFSWSYNGEMADAIKERVKLAGGNVTGDLCCRLAWHNYDDLDLHMIEPNGTHIFFGNKRPHGTTGQLDVDMNAGMGHSREPVENIFYGQRGRMQVWCYYLFVHQFNRRESDNIGFEVELDY